MDRIERRVAELSNDDGMEEAIETVLDAAEGGEVKWVDVRDDLSSGQWGRLIEKEILVDGESGFALADRDAVEAGLETEDLVGGSDVELPEETNWTKWDKAAGGVTMMLFVGYWWEPARDLLGGTVDLLLGPLNSVLPFYIVILLLAIATGLYSTLLRAVLTDPEKMSAYKERMNDIKRRRERAKEIGDDEALDAIQEEQMDAMGDQLGMFKEQFRPMVWIMFLTIPVFLWMLWAVGARGITPPDKYADGLGEVVLPIAGGPVEWSTQIVGPLEIWILWYFVCSMAFNQIIQKSLNISMSPSAS